MTKKSILGNKTFDTTWITKTKPANVQDIKNGVVTTSKLTLYVSLDLLTTTFDLKFNVEASLG
jgi:hypothetical protein